MKKGTMLTALLLVVVMCCSGGALAEGAGDALSEGEIGESQQSTIANGTGSNEVGSLMTYQRMAQKKTLEEAEALYNELLSKVELKELHDTLMLTCQNSQNEAGFAAFTADQVSGVITHADQLYAESQLDVEDKDEYLEMIHEMLSIVTGDVYASVMILADVDQDAVYFLNSQTVITDSVYESMLSAAQSKAETKTSTNLPIKNWKRSSTPIAIKMPAQKSNANVTWQWSETFGTLKLDITKESSIWDGSRLVKKNGKYVTNHQSKRIVDINDKETGYETNNELMKITAIYDNGKATLYDSATWDYPAEHQATGSYSIYRFQGEFELNSDPSANSFTLGNVVNSKGYFHMNDDIFVFIYPKNVTLNDDNFTNYLAFWGGTSTAESRKYIGTFHGIAPNGTGDHTTYSAPIDYLSDKWTINPGVGNASATLKSAWETHLNSGEQGGLDCIIDIFVSECAGNGGMYRPVITISEESTAGKIAVKTTCAVHGNVVPWARLGLKHHNDLKVGVSNEAGIAHIGYTALNTAHTLQQQVRLKGYELYTGEHETIVINEDGSYTVNSVSYSSTNPYSVQLIPKSYTATFDANGGNFGEGITTTSNVYCPCGHFTGTLAVPERLGYKFAGWKVTAVDTNETNWVLNDVYATETGDIRAEMKEKYGNVTLSAEWELALTTLTIKVKDAVSEHNFLFNLQGVADTTTGEIDMNVAVNGNSGVAIIDVPVGSYTVSEVSGWTWRYAGDQSTSITVEGPHEVTFTYSNPTTQWLDGYHYRNIAN